MNRSVSRAAVLALVLLAGWSGAVQADEYSDGWGPPVGSRLAILDARDQAGAERTLDSLTGEHGLLLFLNRSADW